MAAGIVPTEDSRLVGALDGGWKLLDADVSSTNGPNVRVVGDTVTLIIGDSSGDYYSYPYDPEHGTVGARTVFGDVSRLAGAPDGATFDADGGLWCALIGGAQLVRFTPDEPYRVLALPVANPADVAFGGSGLDRLYVVSVRMGSGGGTSTAPSWSSTGSVYEGAPSPGSE